MGRTRMDERGRVLIPVDERKKLGLKTGTEFTIVRDKGFLILKPIIPEPLRVDAKHRQGDKGAFLDAGEATFGEY